MPDPKLKAAMEEIKAVLRKHDIVADVLLGSETHVEYLREFKASWSACWIEPGGVLRIRCKASDYPNKRTHIKALNATIGIIAAFADATRNESEQFTKVLQKVCAESKITFEHMTKMEP